MVLFKTSSGWSSTPPAGSGITSVTESGTKRTFSPEISAEAPKVEGGVKRARPVTKEEIIQAQVEAQAQAQTQADADYKAQVEKNLQLVRESSDYQSLNATGQKTTDQIISGDLSSSTGFVMSDGKIMTPGAKKALEILREKTQTTTQVKSEPLIMSGDISSEKKIEEIAPVKTPYKSDTINAAQSISEYNMRVNAYNRAGIIKRDENTERQLRNDREKLILILKDKYPTLNIEGAVSKVGKTMLDKQIGTVSNSYDINSIMQILEGKTYTSTDSSSMKTGLSSSFKDKIMGETPKKELNFNVLPQSIDDTNTLGQESKVSEYNKVPSIFNSMIEKDTANMEKIQDKKEQANFQDSLKTLLPTIKPKLMFGRTEIRDESNRIVGKYDKEGNLIIIGDSQKMQNLNEGEKALLLTKSAIEIQKIQNAINVVKLLEKADAELLPEDNNLNTIADEYKTTEAEYLRNTKIIEDSEIILKPFFSAVKTKGDTYKNLNAEYQLKPTEEGWNKANNAYNDYLTANTLFEEKSKELDKTNNYLIAIQLADSYFIDLKKLKTKFDASSAKYDMKKAEVEKKYDYTNNEDYLKNNKNELKKSYFNLIKLNDKMEQLTARNEDIASWAETGATILSRVDKMKNAKIGWYNEALRTRNPHEKGKIDIPIEKLIPLSVLGSLYAVDTVKGLYNYGFKYPFQEIGTEIKENPNSFDSNMMKHVPIFGPGYVYGKQLSKQIYDWDRVKGDRFDPEALDATINLALIGLSGAKLLAPLIKAVVKPVGFVASSAAKGGMQFFHLGKYIPQASKFMTTIAPTAAKVGVGALLYGGDVIKLARGEQDLNEMMANIAGTTGKYLAVASLMSIAANPSQIPIQIEPLVGGINVPAKGYALTWHLRKFQNPYLWSEPASKGGGLIGEEISGNIVSISKTPSMVRGGQNINYHYEGGQYTAMGENVKPYQINIGGTPNIRMSDIPMNIKFILPNGKEVIGGDRASSIIIGSKTYKIAPEGYINYNGQKIYGASIQTIAPQSPFQAQVGFKNNPQSQVAKDAYEATKLSFKLSGEGKGQIFPDDVKAFKDPEKAAKVVKEWMQKYNAMGYGSAFNKQQLRLSIYMKYRGKLPEGNPADYDAMLKMMGKADAEKAAKELVASLNKIGETARIRPQNPTLVEIKLNGEWKHGVDIHYPGELGYSATVSPYGIPFEGKSYDMGGVQALYQGEQTARKFASAFVYRAIPGGAGYAPEFHRWKDIPDFIMNLRQAALVNAGTEKGNAITKYANNIEKSLRAKYPFAFKEQSNLNEYIVAPEQASIYSIFATSPISKSLLNYIESFSAYKGFAESYSPSKTSSKPSISPSNYISPSKLSISSSISPPSKISTSSLISAPSKISSPSYNPPSYNPPSYKQPSYNPPSYNPPSYNPPSYNPPSLPKSTQLIGGQIPPIPPVWGELPTMFGTFGGSIKSSATRTFKNKILELPEMYLPRQKARFAQLLASSKIKKRNPGDFK